MLRFACPVGFELERSPLSNLNKSLVWKSWTESPGSMRRARHLHLLQLRLQRTEPYLILATMHGHMLQRWWSSESSRCSLKLSFSSAIQP